MRTDLSSTSTRTFGLWPALALLRAVLLRGRGATDWRFLPLVVAGWLLYRLVGQDRNARGGGGPGLSNPPEQLVTDGVYGLCRNPMYLGLLVTFAGLALMTRSPWFGALFGWHLRWFDDRVAGDEERLVEQFGDLYRQYCDRVPRWLPGLPER